MLIVFSFTRSMPLSLAVLMVMGASQQVYMVTNNTMIQTITPDAFRGRVMSLYHLDNGFAPLGGLLAGAVAEFWGCPTAVLVGGVCAVALVLIMGASLHSLRRA
jgi:MFS family permease